MAAHMIEEFHCERREEVEQVKELLADIQGSSVRSSKAPVVSINGSDDEFAGSSSVDSETDSGASQNLEDEDSTTEEDELDSSSIS